MIQRLRLFDLPIDALNMQQAVEQIRTWLDDDHPYCRFVVTPNVDHTVMLQQNSQLRRVYEDAHLVLADGMPIILASRLLKKPLPERVAGSELVPHLFATASPDRPLRVFLLGAAPGVAERAASRIEAQWSDVRIVGTYSPPLGFESDPAEEQRILERLHESKPEVIVVGLGAPKQELWIHKQHRNFPCACCALCRSDDRFSCRRKTAGARLDAPCRFGMVPPGDHGTASAGRSLRTRCLGLPPPRLA